MQNKQSIWKAAKDGVRLAGIFGLAGAACAGGIATSTALAFGLHAFAAPEPPAPVAAPEAQITALFRRRAAAIALPSSVQTASPHELKPCFTAQP